MAAMRTDIYTSDSRTAFRNFAYMARVCEIGQNNSAATFWLSKAREAFSVR
jgi:hypothetical protein